jgi:hypothetical protein
LTPRFIHDIHRVTTNKAVSWFTQAFGLKTSPLDGATYDHLVASCDVLLDLGRSGQSSPSQRLAEGIEHGKMVLTTNRYLENIGFPFVSIGSGGWNQGLLQCQRAIIDGTPIELSWATNSGAQSFLTTTTDWAHQVLESNMCTYDRNTGNTGNIGNTRNVGVLHVASH